MSPWQPLLGLISGYYFGTPSLNQVAATATLLKVKHTISSLVHFNHYKRQIFSLDIHEYMLCRRRWSGPLKSHILIVGLGKQSVDRHIMRAHVAIKCKQAPVPPTKFSSYFKFWSNRHTVCIIFCISQITMKFCTYQDSCAVLIFAKFYCDLTSFLWMITIIILIKFGIFIKNMVSGMGCQPTYCSDIQFYCHIRFN